MNKDEVLSSIKELSKANLMTQDEILAAYQEGKGEDHALTKKINLADILYYIGGAIIFLGIAILIGQNWSTLPFLSKMLATLGSALASYIVGTLLITKPHTQGPAMAFYLVSALVMPLGLGVVFDYAGYDIGQPATQIAVSGLLLAFYGISLWLLRKTIFVIFTVFFATWFYYACSAFLWSDNSEWGTYLEYLTLASGASYVLLGHWFSKTTRSALSGWLYAFGIIGFLSSAMALGGWKPDQNLIWEVIFPIIIFVFLYLSVLLKSRAVLVFTAAFLMGYILKITAEYFSAGLGWPLALVMAGLLLIASGWLSLTIKRRYMTTTAS